MVRGDSGSGPAKTVFRRLCECVSSDDWDSSVDIFAPLHRYHLSSERKSNPVREERRARTRRCILLPLTSTLQGQSVTSVLRWRQLPPASLHLAQSQARSFVACLHFVEARTQFHICASLQGHICLLKRTANPSCHGQLVLTSACACRCAAA